MYCVWVLFLLFYWLNISDSKLWREKNITGQVHAKKIVTLHFQRISVLQNAKNNNLVLKIIKKIASYVHGNFIYLYF